MSWMACNLNCAPLITFIIYIAQDGPQIRTLRINPARQYKFVFKLAVTFGDCVLVLLINCNSTSIIIISWWGLGRSDCPGENLSSVARFWQAHDQRWRVIRYDDRAKSQFTIYLFSAGNRHDAAGDRRMERQSGETCAKKVSRSWTHLTFIW